MNAPRPVVVTGASSQLGVFLLPRLSDAGFDVQAVSRSAPPGSTNVAGSVRWAVPESGPGDAQGLLSCGPIPLAISFIRKSAGMEKAVVFSTSSVLTKKDSPDKQERREVSGIAAEEAKLVVLCRERGIDLVLLRPTLIYGCGLDRNISLLLRLGTRTGFIPVSSKATGLRKPVHADDLARLAIDSLVANTGSYLESEAGGGSTLTFREMVERIAACGNRRIRVQPLPELLLSFLVNTASRFGPWAGVTAEMVRRQSRDMDFDDSPLRKALGWNPRPFNPTPADFQIPSRLEHYRLPL